MTSPSVFHPARRSHPSGLSLLELLTAVLLAGILSGITLLGYARMTKQWRLNAAVRQLVMDLKVTRNRAIAENIAQRIRFEIPSSLYRRQKQTASQDYADVGPPVSLPDGIQAIDCTARGGAIAFQPRGHASTFGTVTVRDSDGSERRLIVDMAGRMRVER